MGAAIIISICCASFVLAQEEPGSSQNKGPFKAGKDSGLSEFQKQARDYRQEGLRLQKSGDMEGALNFFQKAIEIDPAYAAAYNDIGIIYESLGFADRAEAAYLEAIRLMPELTSPYSNLALLYEGQNRQEDAFIYWSKRAEAGPQDDPWKKKAQDSFNELLRANPEQKEKFIEIESNILINKVSEEKRLKKIEDEKRSEEYYLSSRKYYKNGDYLKALQDLEASLSLDPVNSEKIKFKDEIKSLAQKQERQEKLEEIKNFCNSGLKAYKENNPALAEQEFAKILGLVKSGVK